VVGSGRELQVVGSGRELQVVGSGRELQVVGSGREFRQDTVARGSCTNENLSCCQVLTGRW